MSTPIIIVSGKAGSGKDTVAAYIAEKYNGVCIAQADPMKRFVKNLMGFSDTALWGPSAERNRFVPSDELRKPDSPLTFNQAVSELSHDVFGYPQDESAGNNFYPSLRAWYHTYVWEPLLRDGGISARVVLQTLGTEWGRNYQPKMWVECALRRARQLVEGGYTYTKEEGQRGSIDKAYDYAIITDGRFRNEILGVAFMGGVALRVDRVTKTGPVGIVGHQSEKELDTIPEHFYSGTIMNDSTFETLYHRVDEMMAVQYGDMRK